MDCRDNPGHHTFSLPNYSNSVLMELNKLRQNELFCDVRIHTDEGCVTAHRIVMSAVSPHFKERLSATSNQIDDIHLEDTNHYLVVCLINFIYTGTLVVKRSHLNSMEELLSRIKLKDTEKLFENLKQSDKNKTKRHESITMSCQNMKGRMESDEKMLIKRSRKSKPSKLMKKVKNGIHNGNDIDELKEKQINIYDNSQSAKRDIIPKLIISFGKKGGNMVRERMKDMLHNDETEIVHKKPCVFKDTTDESNKDEGKSIKSISENNTRLNRMMNNNLKLNGDCQKFSQVCDRSKRTKYGISQKDQQKAIVSEYKSDSEEHINDENEKTADLIAEKDRQGQRSEVDSEGNVSVWTLENIDSLPKKNKHKIMLSKSNTCKTCDITLSSRKEYLLHVKTHIQDKTQHTGNKIKQKYWPCTVCSKNLTSYVRHACHQYSKHGIPYDSKLKLHACTSEGCKYITASKHYLQIHMQGRHGNKRPHVCEYCGKGFKLPSALITHLNIHTNKKRFDCEECGMSFHQKGGLDIHMKKHHEGQQSWSELCHLCSEKFLHKADLCWHLFISHGLPVPDRYKVFACELCDYKTIRKNKLTRHMDSHQNNRSFVCSVCGKKFVTKSYLNRHMKYHGEKTYNCEYEGCTYSCVDQIGLKKHVRLMHTHKNYKPFSCTMCTYKTGLRGNLDKHIRTVHNLEVVTKHTVHLKMKFKDRQSGDIITKDGQLVQAAGQKVVPETENSLQLEEQTDGTGGKEVNLKNIKNVVEVLHLPTHNTGNTTLQGQSNRPSGQLQQQPLADVPNQAFNSSNQVQFPMVTNRIVPSANEPAANQSDLFLTIDPLTSFKYFMGE